MAYNVILVVGGEEVVDMVAQRFVECGFYADADLSNDRLKKKIRNNQQMAYNVILVVGGEEVENQTVNVRLNNGTQKGVMPIEDALSWLVEMRETYARDLDFDKQV